MNQQGYSLQAFVQTRFLDRTDYRGERVKATNVTSGKSVTVSWNYGLDVEANHLAAAVACLVACEQEVPVRFVACGTKDSRGYFFTAAR